jgi:alpha-glucosidase
MLLSGLAIAHLAMAQASFVSDNQVAVFYPAHYDAAQHEPSPIFEHEPATIYPLPSNWQVRPSFSERDGKRVVTIRTDKNVDFYGTGEVTGPLRRNGRTIGLWNIDTPAYGVDGGTHLYQSHPWVMGLRPDGTAFGVIADNTWKQSISIADGQITFESEGPAFRVFIIERESPQALMQALVQLTGTMELPPLWSLGYQQCRFSYHPDTRVKEIADLLRQNRIPSDVIWMDIHYMDNYKIFTFHPKEFSDPKGLNDYLHSKNLKAVYMIDPGVKVEPGYFVDDQGTAADYWVKDKDGKPFVGNVWPGACHFPDFTRPEVRTWWATLYRNYMATGIDGVWNDMNEPSVFGGPDGTMPIDNKHKGGEGVVAGSHLRFHNVFGLNMVRASRQGLLLANPNKRPFILSRSNFLGGHRYAATWTGDNLSSPEQMRLSIPMTLTLGLSGQPFNGPDIGGFCESATGDLVAQWTAMGVFFPFVRNHTIDGSADQEPWAFTPEVLNACRTAIERRYVLMPYIYTAFREASVNGMPVMRPLFMADAKDLSLRSEDKAFLLGGDLMVTPRWAENVAQPDNGTWQVVDLSSLTSQPSPLTSDKYQAELRQRPGSVIPMANLAQSTTEMRTDSLTLFVCLDADGIAKGQLYEDEGDGFSYREGNYALSSLNATLNKKQLTININKVEGRMECSNRVLRIAYVKAGKVQYSAWQSGNIATMKIKK